MILASINAAWIEREDKSRVPFDAARLADSVIAAALIAGHDDWWLADVVAAAIYQYACDAAPAQTVTAHEIVNLVVRLLDSLGYGDIATAYAQRRRRADVRLDELAGVSGTACELAFYQQLDGALHAAVDEQLVLLRVRGLRRCVLQLRGVRRWNDGCRRLAEDIVSHVRGRVERLRPAQAVELRLAVSE